MANKFEFRKHSCEVDIAGNIFELDCSTEMGETMKDIAGDFRQIAEDVSAKTKTTEQALTLYLNSIDTILGAGAVKKIFVERKATLDDAIDVIYYLMDQVQKFSRNRMPHYAGTPAPGRRSHGKKKKG